MPAFDLLVTLATIVGVMAVAQGTCAYLIFLERKICAWMQNRIGPNRVGPWGLLQSIADGLKFLLKEEIIPTNVDRTFYILAPAIAVMTALLALAVVPFGPTSVPPEPPLSADVINAQRQHEYAATLLKGHEDDLIRTPTPEQQKQDYQAALEQYRHTYQFMIAPNVDIGILFIFAVTSLTVYAIILGGWASNNKYSLLGALRSSAQIVSYEIPMGMSVLGVVLFTGSLNLEKMIGHQTSGVFAWNIWFQPLGFILFLVSVFAECNRLPFDLPEAEQELVGGYHTEYSALKLALFFLGEYTHVITTSFLMVILFFGGWQFPWIAEADSTGPLAMALKIVVFLLKMASFIVFYMLVRWTIPRFRFDQLMSLAWKVMIPLALVNVVCVMIVKHLELQPWLLFPLSFLVLLGAGLLAGRWREAPRRAIRVTRGHEEMEVLIH